MSEFFSIPTTKEDAPFSVIVTGNALVSELGQLTVLTFMLSSVTGTWKNCEACKGKEIKHVNQKNHNNLKHIQDTRRE